jgi:hydroxymethylpyrimidine pyrophosphatase-like HAD family hydrolase
VRASARSKNSDNLMSMQYLALATDYDGTIAHHGAVEPATVEALCEFKGSGRRLILVTGRELPDLFNVFSEPRIFDRIVAENGALLYNPATEQKRTLAPAPPDGFINRLRELGVKALSVGCVIVATQEIYASVVHRTIAEMGLRLEVILNKGAAMVLPTGTDKATGLRAALQELNLGPESVVGVGDAENDAAFLKICGYSVAVANALPSLKEQAAFVTTKDHGAGVRELVRGVFAREYAAAP